MPPPLLHVAYGRAVNREVLYVIWVYGSLSSCMVLVVRLAWFSSRSCVGGRTVRSLFSEHVLRCTVAILATFYDDNALRARLYSVMCC
jgi:hypothetical protein